jgi:hypothetical protein
VKSVVGAARFSTDWLALRERADAAARAPDLLDPLRGHLAEQGPELVIADLGAGTGSMARWLAGRLGGAQRWILHDRDPELLDRAAERLTGDDHDHPVTVETRVGDLTLLRAPDLAGVSLVTASALLDLLTFGEVDTLAEAISTARRPALFTLSVAGTVELDPFDPLDPELTAAFNAHQRRTADGRRLLGPDAARVAAAAFERRGATVSTRSSPWRLGPQDAALTAEWLRGWVGAAREQRPELADRCDAYLRRRLDACEAGEVRVTVHHIDLLALPAVVATLAPTADGRRS